MENAIAFDRLTEGWSGYDPELVSFRPGMAQPVSRLTHQGGEPVIETRHIQPALDALRAGRSEAAQAVLAEALEPTIADLLPFTIQD